MLFDLVGIFEVGITFLSHIFLIIAYLCLFNAICHAFKCIFNVVGPRLKIKLRLSSRENSILPYMGITKAVVI